MGKPLINILTRTSNRPNGFDINIHSVKNQTYPNIKHIVSYDNDSDLEYINKYDNLVTLKIDRDSLISNDTSVNPDTGIYSPHNLYFNEMIKLVDEGWVIYLDDDDKFMHHKVIEQIVKVINRRNDDTLIVWRFKLGESITLPIEFSTEHPPTLGEIGGSCIAFHSKYKSNVTWDAWKCSDFRVLDTLYRTIPHFKFIKRTYVHAPIPGSGNRIDI